MIEAFKLLNGYDYVNEVNNKLLVDQVRRTRGHSFKLIKPRSRTNLRKHSFFHRIVDPWNCLPEQVVMASSINQFKSELNKLWRNHPDKFEYMTRIIQ